MSDLVSCNAFSLMSAFSFTLTCSPFQENRYTLLGISDELEEDDQPTLSLEKLKSVPTVSTKHQFMAVSEDSIAFTTVTNILSFLNRKTAKKIEGVK